MSKTESASTTEAPAQQPAPKVEEVTREDERPELPGKLPILPLRQTVLFPGTVVPLTVGRSSSLRLLDDWLPQSKIIALVAQRDSEVEEPGPDDLYEVGCAAAVLKLIREQEGGVTLLVRGLHRIRLGKITEHEPYLQAEIKKLEEKTAKNKELEAAFKTLRQTASELVSLSRDLPEQVSTVVANLEEPGHLADFLAANLDIGVPEQQDLLEELNVAKRVRAVQLVVSRQTEIARLQQQIHQDVESNISDMQRKAYLREQLKVIRRELGESEDGTAEQADELRRRLQEAEPPEEVMKEAERELARMEQIPAASPEFSVILNYLETLAELPWNRHSEDNLELDRAREILDRDHHDLEKVKRRLIEYLAVRKLNPEGHAPILCFVGPPGVGKTSLGQSIADALGRRFVRMSLGGIRDEAEIRGHRRTYIGAMPGRIIQEMRRAGTKNPVMMLDEVDKLGADFRGDPASALLEVLDPWQNKTFSDRYLDVPFDLSQVIFIATANYLDPVPPALRDRMEVIEIPGYTDADKLRIAQKYLVPRQMKENGLKSKHCRFTKSALRKLIHGYTREAGVRELERRIGAVCRAIAAQVAAGELKQTISVKEEQVRELLGPEQYQREVAQRVATPGVVTALAYTPTGGEVLFVEATRYEGKGQLHMTGQIGTVMKESAQAALSLVRSRADQLGLDAEVFNKSDLHVHVPAGAVPKDGPSAGIAMFTSIASLLLQRPCKPSVAMTGEITLRGLVLPVGGIKEKSLAAMRAGIRTVLLPKRNEKDLPDVPDEAKEKLEIVFVETVDEVLERALKTKPVKNMRQVEPAGAGS